MALSDKDLDTIFRTARSYNGWQDKAVPATLIQAVYELAIMGPTSANSCPARFVFVTSDEAKERLKPYLLDSNVEKVMSAPVTAIIGHDLEFFELIPELMPHNPDAKSWFDSDEDVARVTAFRNGTLQGAYLMIAARSLGLDCGPMSGFDNAGVDSEFFAGTNIKSNFICALGYGKEDSIFSRNPRPSFDDVCRTI